MMQKRFVCWMTAVAVVMIATIPAFAQEHSLLLSTSGDAATQSATYANIDDEEVLVFSPPGQSEPVEFLSDIAWEVILGDADADGAFDDEPGEVDALHLPVEFVGRPTLFDMYVSFSSTESLIDGTDVLDGDVVRVTPGGGAVIAYDEATFETITGTSNVDVDAFAIDAEGTIYFSFADTEETAYEVIAQENGGDPALADGTIFHMRAGDTFAHILHTEDEVLEMVRAALGVSNSSIGDTQGLCPDPVNAGHLWFAISSTSSSLEGTVFSTAGGGSVATLNGFTLHGASFGFETEEALDSLALSPATKNPLQMQVDSPDFPASDASQVEIRVLNGTPNGRARLVASPPVMPVLAPVPAAGLAGVGLFYVDTASTLFANSSTRPKFEISLDANGSGLFAHPPRPIPAGLQRLVQVIDVTSLEISEPLAIEVVAP